MQSTSSGTSSSRAASAATSTPPLASPTMIVFDFLRRSGSAAAKAAPACRRSWNMRAIMYHGTRGVKSPIGADPAGLPDPDGCYTDALAKQRHQGFSPSQTRSAGGSTEEVDEPGR